MGNPRDRIDDWLNAEVEPLAPPPGTFQRIRQRARRRRVGRAVMSAAGIVIVIAAAVAVPQIATTLQSHGGRTGRPVAAGTPPASARPSVTGSGGESPNSRSSSKFTPPSSSRLSAAGSGDFVPPNFQPTSVTFVGPNIGAVIGQAGTPGQCASPYCTSLAGTSDYGTTWYGVSAPVTGPPDGSSGVGQIRFLNTSYGWAFGPQLWATTDGGATWTQERTYGMRVTDLETAGDRAFALFATCTGTGADYAASCTSFSLYTSTAGSSRWQPVAGPVSDLGLPQTAGTQAASASLVLAGDRGYLLAPSGELLTGPLTGAAWTIADAQARCSPGPNEPGGQPTGALLAAGSGQLILVCTSATSAAGDSQTKIVMQSSNGGMSWSTAGDGPSAGIATSLAAAQGNVVVLATDAGLYLSTNGGVSWQQAQSGPVQAKAGERGFSYVGMTSSTQGVALPADPDLHEVFITTDGGSTWQPHLISPP